MAKTVQAVTIALCVVAAGCGGQSETSRKQAAEIRQLNSRVVALERRGVSDSTRIINLASTLFGEQLAGIKLRHENRPLRQDVNLLAEQVYCNGDPRCHVPCGDLPGYCK